MSPLTTISDGLDLTARERQLIACFRAMDDFQRDALFGLAHCYVGIEPAPAARLTLAHSGPGRAQQ